MRLTTVSLAVFLAACLSQVALSSLCRLQSQPAGEKENSAFRPPRGAWGPVNLLASLRTPFHPPAESTSPSGSPSTSSKLSEPIKIGAPSSEAGRPSLAERLVPARLYLPGRMVLGRSAEFTVTGKPGATVALAMADKDTGAKPIYGRELRLGPDRKVVSAGEIPRSGVLKLYVAAPIQGDLVGQHLYFEAAVWSRADFTDTQVAATISSRRQEGVANGVLVSQDTAAKSGLKFSAVAQPPAGEPDSIGLSRGRP